MFYLTFTNLSGFYVEVTKNKTWPGETCQVLSACNQLITGLYGRFTVFLDLE